MVAQATAISAALEQALRRGGLVERRETHVSWVFLTADRAYKLKKPVHFGFVDLRTPQARHWACEEEVRVNRALAPDVVLGVRGVVRTVDGCALAEPTSPDAVDWVVEMRRFDEARTMAALIGRGALPPGAPAAVAARIARFHATTDGLGEAHHARATLAEVEENLAELAELAVEWRDALDRIGRFVTAFVASRRDELDGRGRAGRVRDGHGDLRAEHVVLEDDRVTIVDRLEFDPALRRVDVADDLAFLVMDLQALGAHDVAEHVLAGYRAAGGDPGDDALVAFFGAHRALVRAKVARLRAQQQGQDDDAAARLIALAERLTWRARPRMAILVHGPPASGKTSLAHALAGASGFPVVSTDLVRKELLGLDLAHAAPPAAYSASARGRVYGEVGRRAAAVLRTGSVIVDATLGDPAARRPLLDALANDRDRLLAVECRTPVETLVRRAADRARQGGSASDAGPAEAGRLARAFTPVDEVPAEQRLAVDGEQSPADQVGAVAIWFDERMRVSAVDRAR